MHCSQISYNLYSTEDFEELVLYPDGPCRDTGVATAIINVTLLPCPAGFQKSEEKCVCEERLQAYNVSCTIDRDISIMRRAGSRVWIDALYDNETYQGLILSKTCPVEYCKTEAIALSLDNSDIQCANNRSGVLCGACATNYSLMLGSSRCEECSNAYLALLLPFAAAGIALVAFLSILRLTVATGFINSILLYANIVQVNKQLFFPTNQPTILSVFIAWVNLDLGLKTCFYGGMTAYMQTWLQFSFPLFVWILISLIIVISGYSIIVSKLIGHNPIAVLATLLLMSYTKLLRIIIDVYSHAELSYPQNVTVTVWLKDANVPYLKSKHLILAVVTALVFIFLFLPYTLFLLLGYKLYRFSGKKCFCWVIRLKPLLDSYYAPYHRNTRYWSGFLLLICCALYVVFLYNSYGETNKSLLAIIVTFTGIGFAVGFNLTGQIYTNIYVNFIEASIYFNLIVLSCTTLAGCTSSKLVIAKVLIIMLSFIVYSLHVTYTTKSRIWLRIKSKVSNLRKLSQPSQSTTDAEIGGPLSQDPHTIVSRTVIDLREPLIETYM